MRMRVKIDVVSEGLMTAMMPGWKGVPVTD
jgi:hypothetical protein